MPVHHWTNVPDGIDHAFHHRWISAICDDLNTGRLPAAYYALPEQIAAGFGPDVLLVIDPFPPGRRDPNGVHAAIWEAWAGEGFELPDDKRLTLVSFECGLTTRAYIEPVAVGDVLPDMALFIEPENCVLLPLEETYRASYEVMPARWRDVLDVGR